MTLEMQLAVIEHRLEDLDRSLHAVDVRTQLAALRLAVEEAYVTAQDAKALANSLAGRVAALEAGDDE